jgi:Helix-turn-helix domain
MPDPPMNPSVLFNRDHLVDPEVLTSSQVCTLRLRLTILLHQRGLPLGEVAEMVGWERTTLWKKLTHRRKVAVGDVERLAEVIGIPQADSLMTLLKKR